MKKFIAILLSLILICLITGCGDSNSSAIVYYGAINCPKTLDPQTASSFVELMLVRNIYEGLLRQDSDGKIVNGIAENYNQSGLTYTFKLKKDAVWSNGESVTAHDFVFAFRRALDPRTESPNAQLLYAVKNAEAVHKSGITPNLLGVTATDNHTLKIELDYTDSNFLYTLTTAICMPCNEDFFISSVGKYGMSLETTLSNGSYKLTKWNVEDFAMRILKNDQYKGNFVPKNSAVYFSKSNEYTTLETLNKSSVDIAEINCGEITTAKKDGFLTKTMQNKVLLLSLGNGYSRNMKRALHSSLIKADDFADINESYSFADTLLPDVLQKNEGKTNIYSPTVAKKIYDAELKKLDGVFPESTLIYYGDDAVTDILKAVAGHWQQNLGAYLNISKLDSDSSVIYKSSLNKHHIAAYSFEINENNREAYFEKLKTSDTINQENIFKYSNIIPLAYYGTVFAYDECLTEIKFFDTNGFIDFSCVVKDI